MSARSSTCRTRSALIPSREAIAVSFSARPLETEPGVDDLALTFGQLPEQRPKLSTGDPVEHLLVLVGGQGILQQVTEGADLPFQPRDGLVDAARARVRAEQRFDLVEVDRCRRSELGDRGISMLVGVDPVVR